MCFTSTLNLEIQMPVLSGAQPDSQDGVNHVDLHLLGIQPHGSQGARADWPHPGSWVV